MHGQRVLSRGDHLDACANGGPIRSLTDELDGKPVIPLAGILEENVVVTVAGGGAAHVNEDIDIAVAVPIAAGHAVSLLQVAGARGRGDVAEALAGHIPEQAIGDKGLQGGVSGAQVKVQVAVIVEVAEVRAHGGKVQVEPGLAGHVLEPPALQVAIKPIGPAAVRQAAQPLDRGLQRAIVAGGEEIEPAVVIKIPRPAGKADFRPVDAHGLGDVGEGAVAIIVK